MALITTETNLDYLITPLRLHIGDIDETDYDDDTLRTYLVYAVKSLMNRWNNRYLINDDTNDAERNGNYVYIKPSPPLIQHQDERPIILQASILVKSSSLYDNSWNIGAWKDDEVSFSNVTGGRSVEDSLKRDIEELEGLWPVARKRLAQPQKQSLLGFKGDTNEFEG